MRDARQYSQISASFFFFFVGILLRLWGHRVAVMATALLVLEKRGPLGLSRV